MRAVKRACAALVMLLALAGCTSSKPGASTSSNSSKTATPSSPSVPLVQNSLPASVANQPAVRKNITQTGCAAVDGGWSAKGTATNSSSRKVTYKLTVYFTTTQATVLDFAQASVVVAPGKTVPWSVSKKFLAQPTMNCALVGVAAS
ncbi:MAG: hypothetical protein ABI232_01300 [Jatrophihabitantaceae bacterium]